MNGVLTRNATRPCVVLGTAVSVTLFAGMASSLDENPVGTADTESTRSIVATSPAGKPLNLLLTQAELRSVVRNYEIETGEVLTAPIDDEEVVVRAPGMLAPMRDVSQDVGGGILAPFWAIMNPKQAWRIFVPIPPKGPQREARPTRAEDRVDKPISALDRTGVPTN